MNKAKHVFNRSWLSEFRDSRSFLQFTLVSRTTRRLTVSFLFFSFILRYCIFVFTCTCAWDRLSNCFSVLLALESQLIRACMTRAASTVARTVSAIGCPSAPHGGAVVDCQSSAERHACATRAFSLMWLVCAQFWGYFRTIRLYRKYWPTPAPTADADLLLSFPTFRATARVFRQHCSARLFPRKPVKTELRVVLLRILTSKKTLVTFPESLEMRLVV